MIKLKQLINFKKKPRRRFIVETHVDRVKWALSSLADHAYQTLEAAGVSPLSGPDPSAEFLSVVRKYKIQPNEVVSLLPRYQVTVRNLELPSTEPGEIKKIVDLQAVKQTPYTAEEIVFAYEVLKSRREGYSSIMLVIAHRDVLNAHLKVLQDVGLRSESITLSTGCSAEWVSHALKGLPNDEISAVVDVDADRADFYLCQRESIFYTQNLSFGSQKMKEDPSVWGEKVLDELARALQIYRSEEISKEPSMLILTGAYQSLMPLAGKLTSATGLPLREVPLDEAARRQILAQERGEEWVDRQSFTAVLGLAQQEKPAINLIPQEITIRASFMEKSRNLLIAGVLSLSIFLVVIAIFVSRYYDKLAYLQWLKQQAAVTAPSALEVQQNRSHVREILTIHYGNARLFDVFGHLAHIMPHEIYLTDLNLNKEDELLIQGRSDSMTGALELVNQLKADKNFQDVEAKRLTKRIVDNKEIVDFEISSHLALKGGGEP